VDEENTVRTFDQLFIGGTWRPSLGTSTLDVISPATEQVIGRVPEASEADIDVAVDAARVAFDRGPWSRMSPADRAAALAPLADTYFQQLDDMATVITDEMGSPIGFSQLAQSAGSWAAINAFLKLSAEHPWEETRSGMTGDIVVRREGVGVVAAIVPWNMPQLSIMVKLVPALLAGCAVVVKPSPESPLDAMLLADLLADLDLPAGVVSIVPAGREVGEHLVRHPDIDKVAFTGSTAVGRRIATICGEQLKRASLELGGKSAAIILDDADLSATIGRLKGLAFINSGQTCAAQTRVLASRRRYAEVVDALATMTSSLTVGDPHDSDTEIGPMVAKRQQERVNDYIGIGEQEGARLVVGGRDRPAGLEQGWYVTPTLFADVDNRMRIAQEEIFGPVLSVIPYDDVDDAVRLANDSPYGLAGSVWTEDLDHGMEIARQVRTGSYGINCYTSDFGVPFGGFKASGIGRESGPEGMDEYVELKTIAQPPAPS
jgi:betaine-aldehyde dehydrogenase